MTAIFQASVTVSGDSGLLEAFKQHITVLLSEESSIQNFQEQYISNDLTCRFETNQGIPFPALVTASQAFPDLMIKLQWMNHRDAVNGSAVMQNGKLTDQHLQSLADSARDSGAMQLDIAVEKNGYLRHAMAFRNIGAGEYAGYVLTGKHNAFFKISKQHNLAELYSSNGLGAEWTEHWTYNEESRNSGYQELIPGEKIDDDLYQVLDALVNDFLDEWVWFSESPLEDIIIERQKYERMGLTWHVVNIKSEKIRKMTKADTGQENCYRFSTVRSDCRWIKTVITACRAIP